MDLAMETLQEIFGTGRDLNALQMSARAVAFFFITLIYIRIAGMRTFGKKSSVDIVIVIILGSVVARGISGASGFSATLASSAVLVLVYRFTSWLTLKSRTLERLVKGNKLLLFSEGSFNEKNMQQAGISRHDFMESLRLTGKGEDLTRVASGYMESNGQLSFTFHPKNTHHSQPTISA